MDNLTSSEENMILDVSGVLGTESARLDFKREFDLRPESISVSEICHAEIEGSFVNSAGYALLTAKLRVSYETECARCLEKLDRVLETEISYPVAESLENNDNDDYLIPEGGRINLADLSRDTFILELPMTELCKEDCRGLCQTCGKNLNTGLCSCPQKRIDPRLEKLKDFFKE